MRRLLFALIAMGCCLAGYAQAQARTEAVPRKVVALYDGGFQENVRLLAIHRFFEMPLNLLGLDVEYHDIRQPLPALGDEVRGLIIGFDNTPELDAATYLNWLENALKSGKRLVLVESIGIHDSDALDDALLRQLRGIYKRVGLYDTNNWYPLTHKSVVLSRDTDMVDFERRIDPPLRPFEGGRVTAQGTSHLRVAVDGAVPEEYADLVVTGPQGGYVASGYAYYEQELQERYVTAWYINPFAFLRKALLPDRFPVPDVTTRVGRRIFYSHIDGDGWNNMSLIEEFRDKRLSSADVIEHKILRAYPDFAFSVGIVAADMVDGCFGSDHSRATARSILALPNVEASNHTFTHPLYWQFYEDYSPEKELPFAGAFPKRAGLFSQNVAAIFDRNQRPQKHELQQKPEREMSEMERVYEMYDAPRSYNCVAFDEDMEIDGAKQVILDLAPEGTKIRLMQWSGNTAPYERFLRKTREAGMFNINGGESRFDNEYPSYSSLFPIGVQIGKERQIYSTASNENTYTNLWSERFFGYRYLIETVRHTEVPLRISPFNVYFHSYSGERPASLRALQEIMNYARDAELLPMFTSDFAAIANGFYTTRMVPLGERRWRVEERGQLQTLRFDNAGDWRVDFSRSEGVLGERLHQGNLYIFLNPSHKQPEVALGKGEDKDALALTSSRWDILQAVRQKNGGISMRVRGFGKGRMHWRVPQDGTYQVATTGREGKVTAIQAPAKEKQIVFEFEAIDGIEPIELHIIPPKAVRNP